MSKEFIKLIDDIVEDQMIFEAVESGETVELVFDEYKKLLANLASTIDNIKSTGSVTNVGSDKFLAVIQKNVKTLRDINSNSKKNKNNGSISGLNLTNDLNSISTSLKNASAKIENDIFNKLTQNIELPSQEDENSAEFADTFPDEEETKEEIPEPTKKKRKIF